VRFAKISKRAHRDLQGIQQHIARNNPQAANRVWQTFLDTADLLASNITAWQAVVNASPRHQDVRSFLIPRFQNYLIFYRPYEDTIMVLRVLCAAQDWKRFFGGTQSLP
jgi:plasmid stabilization system protein ParE